MYIHCLRYTESSLNKHWRHRWNGKTVLLKQAKKKKKKKLQVKQWQLGGWVLFGRTPVTRLRQLHVMSPSSGVRRLEQSCSFPWSAHDSCAGLKMQARQASHTRFRRVTLTSHWVPRLHHSERSLDCSPGAIASSPCYKYNRLTTIPSPPLAESWKHTNLSASPVYVGSHARAVMNELRNHVNVSRRSVSSALSCQPYCEWTCAAGLPSSYPCERR